MNAKDLRLQYLTNYISAFCRLVSSVTQTGRISPKEALGLSNMLRKLLLFCPPSILVQVQAELLQNYLEQVGFL